MKILHVAVFNSKSTNKWQAIAFENQGCEVIRYNYRTRAKKLDGGLNPVNPNRDKELINICKVEKPDIALFSKCNKLHIDVIKECNKVCKTVLWYMDPIGNVDKELIEKMKYCNYVFCSRFAGIDEAKKHNKHVYRLQGGYNPEVHYPMNLKKTRVITFMGNIKSGRKRYIDAVNAEVIKGAFNEDHSRIASESKINLSFSEGDGISNRLYKLLAARGFVLTQPWRGLKKDFTPSKDFDIFNSVNELKSKAKFYLSHRKLRNDIAKHGFNTVQRYDHNNYAKKILKITSI